MGGDFETCHYRETNLTAPAAALLGAIALLGGPRADGQVSVTTYHYDNHRTGWNPAETV